MAVREDTATFIGIVFCCHGSGMRLLGVPEMAKQEVDAPLSGDGKL